MRRRIADCRLPIDAQRAAARSHRRSALRKLCLFAALPLIELSVAGCGYTVGAPFAPEIRTVHVPTFTSNTNRRGIEYQLTEAVQKQIQQRSHFRLSKGADADTLLRGRVVDYSKRVLGQTGNSDPRQLEMNLQVEVTWEDARTGEILRQQRIPIAPEALALAAQSDFAPEIGQSLATGTNDAVNRLARNIVDMMESPW